MDAFGDAAEKDDTSPFVELLWEHGLDHENAIAAQLNITTNLKSLDAADRERETRAAAERHEPLIYGAYRPPLGCIQSQLTCRCACGTLCIASLRSFSSPTQRGFLLLITV